MKQLDLLNELKDALGQLAYQIEASAAMQLYDVNKVAENLILGLMREIMGWQHLRNLNTDDQVNFPGIDLADDNARIAIQVTSTSTLDKIKGTISTFVSHDLNKKYDRLIVYVLTKKQNSYSQNAIDQACQQSIKFDAEQDVMDFRDLATKAVSLSPQRLLAAVEVVRAYLRGGVPAGLAAIDFDPTKTILENVTLNILGVYFPNTLYVADLRPEIRQTKKGGKPKNERKMVREYLTQFSLRAPSDYEVRAGQLISFHQLDDSNGPFHILIDSGTITPLTPREFYRIDDDHERVFKSLLRFCLQQKLFKHFVQWKHEDGLFIFVPRPENDLLREETWFGQRQSTRRVFEKKLNKNDQNKVFTCKHFAFGADFLEVDDGWYVALTPDWFFSYGDGFRRSAFADDQISWLKRRENNRTVQDHFRFLASWLANLDQDDLFSSMDGKTPTLTFGEAAKFSNHPKLDDDAWLPARDDNDDDDQELAPIAKLFGTT